MASDKIIFLPEEPRGPSELIEVVIDANGRQRFKLPTVDQLKSQVGVIIIIKAMRLITSEILVGPMTAQGANAPLTELQKMALVIHCDGWEKAHYIPILTMNDTATPGGTFPHRYQSTRFADWKNVDFNQSYLQFANGTVSAGAPYTVLIEVEYERLGANLEAVVGPI